MKSTNCATNRRSARPLPSRSAFRSAPATRPKPATMKLSPSVDPCDQAAGEPLDLQGVVPGLLPNEIGDGAVEACEAAVKAYPDVARFRYELGRALLAAGKVDEARKAIQEAADKGHVRAVFELGYIASSGIGTAVDRTKANGFYAQASDKGDPYGMTAWGRALFNGRRRPARYRQGAGPAAQGGSDGAYQCHERSCADLQGRPQWRARRSGPRRGFPQGRHRTARGLFDGHSRVFRPGEAR